MPRIRSLVLLLAGFVSADAASVRIRQTNSDVRAVKIPMDDGQALLVDMDDAAAIDGDEGDGYDNNSEQQDQQQQQQQWRRHQLSGDLPKSQLQVLEQAMRTQTRQLESTRQRSRDEEPKSSSDHNGRTDGRTDGRTNGNSVDEQSPYPGGGGPLGPKDCLWYRDKGIHRVPGCEDFIEYDSTHNSTDDNSTMLQPDHEGDTESLFPPYAAVVFSVALEGSPNELTTDDKRQLLRLSTQVITKLLETRSPFHVQLKGTRPQDDDNGPPIPSTSDDGRHHDPLANLVHETSYLNPALAPEGNFATIARDAGSYAWRSLRSAGDANTARSAASFSSNMLHSPEIGGDDRSSTSNALQTSGRFLYVLPPNNTETEMDIAPFVPDPDNVSLPDTQQTSYDDGNNSVTIDAGVAIENPHGDNAIAAGNETAPSHFWYHIQIDYEAYWLNGARILNAHVLGNISHVCTWVLNDAIEQEYVHSKLRHAYILDPAGDGNFPVLAVSILGLEDESDIGPGRLVSSKDSGDYVSSDSGGGHTEHPPNEDDLQLATFAHRIDAFDWELREWFGLGLMIFTISTTSLLVLSAHSMRHNQKQHQTWKQSQYLTEDGIQELLQVGWDYQQQGGTQQRQASTTQQNSSSATNHTTSHSGRSQDHADHEQQQQLFLRVYDKSRIGYSDENSVLRGGSHLVHTAQGDAAAAPQILSPHVPIDSIVDRELSSDGKMMPPTQMQYEHDDGDDGANRGNDGETPQDTRDAKSESQDAHSTDMEQTDTDESTATITQQQLQHQSPKSLDDQPMETLETAATATPMPLDVEAPSTPLVAAILAPLHPVASPSAM